MKRAWVIILGGFLGCARGGSSNPPEPPPAPSQQSQSQSQPQPQSQSQDDCTLDTPLIPGVPGSPGHLLPSEINPNGVSELAALMRTMQRDLAEAGERIRRGEIADPEAYQADPSERLGPTVAHLRSLAGDTSGGPA